jgi:hypothetical protein
MTDYTLLKQADAELGIEDIEAAAAELSRHGQTVTVDVTSRDAREILLGTGQYGLLHIVADTELTSDATAQQKQLRVLAIEAVAVLDKAEVIAFANPTKAVQIRTAFTMLVQAGIVSQTSADAIVALSQQWRPDFPGGVTVGDLQTVRSM